MNEEGGHNVYTLSHGKAEIREERAHACPDSRAAEESVHAHNRALAVICKRRISSRFRFKIDMRRRAAAPTALRRRAGTTFTRSVIVCVIV